MSIAFSDFVKVLEEFGISSADDLRRRLAAGPAPVRNTSTDWHDGYVAGFIKAGETERRLLADKMGRIGSRVEVLERDLKAVCDRVTISAKPTRRKARPRK